MNPFQSPAALSHSFYATPDASAQGRLVAGRLGSDISGHEMYAQGSSVHSDLREFIRIKTFPCVLGRSAVNKNNYRFGIYNSALNDDCLDGLAHDLWEFVNEQPFGEHFSTFVVTFETPEVDSEIEFEKLLWQVLQALHDRDKATWDATTSSSPENEKFSYSFAGRSYFVVGLHPTSSRNARRFRMPALAFNAHFQFQELKTQSGKDGQGTMFETFQRLIRRNDMALQGSINPSLSEVEAKQYSGRLAEKTWQCPFRP